MKANAGMLDGLPEPITLAPAPITLRLDLPGIAEHGTFVVEEPPNSAVQAGLDQALGWWNDNAYKDGYVNPANSSYRASTAFSSEQLALNVGLNVRWASGSVASQFSHTSTATSSVAMMVYKQVFYTVTLDTPESPAAMFADSVMRSQAEAQMVPESPPAYVHSVSYGRIIMFRMETSESVKSTEMEAAMKYAAGVSVDLTVESRYKEILQKSSMSAITIGGNAEVASKAIEARKLRRPGPHHHRLQRGVLEGEPERAYRLHGAVPQGQHHREDGLHDALQVDRVQRLKESRITVYNGGIYVARAFARYYPRNQPAVVTVGTGNFTQYLSRVLVIPAGATDLELWADAEWFIASWDRIGYVKWDVGPGPIKYCLRGTSLSHSWGPCD